MTVVEALKRVYEQMYQKTQEPNPSLVATHIMSQEQYEILIKEDTPVHIKHWILASTYIGLSYAEDIQ